MKTLKETLLDGNLDISTGLMIFDRFYNHPNVVNDGLRLRSNDELDDAINEIIAANLAFMEDIDPEKMIDSILSDPKFIRVIKKSKCKRGIYCDVPESSMDEDFNNELWEVYSDFKNKHIGRIEFKKKLKDAFLTLEIYSFDEYYFVFLIGNDNVIYGFIACD